MRMIGKTTTAAVALAFAIGLAACGNNTSSSQYAGTWKTKDTGGGDFDITLAADTAKFQVPEMAHNIMPTMVMSALVDRVPRKPMTYLVWSTAVIDPARAREAGIVSEVVPAAELDAAVDALCKQIMRAPRPARVGCKDYARSALDMDVAGAIEFARSIHAVINSSSEMLPQGHK